MNRATLIEEEFNNKYIADEGYVITNYKEGDSQIVYSKGLIFNPGSTLSGFYTMLESEAKTIKASLDTQIEEDSDYEIIEE